MLETILGILITIVLVAIAIIISKLWPTLRAVLPLWATNTLAFWLVRWAESEYKGKKGKEKFSLVLEKVEAWLAAFNIHIDSDIVAAAIEAAWNKMNLEQVAAGVKEGTAPKEVEGDAE